MQQPNEQQPQQGNPNQDLYDIFVSQGIKIASEVGQSMRGKASVELLGNTLFDIVNRIEAEGQKHGIVFDLDVLLHGSNEILGHLLKVAQVDITEDQIKAVIGIAVGQWVINAVQTGKMTPEQLQAMVQQQGGQNAP
jgi:hypothetical protein